MEMEFIDVLKTIWRWLWFIIIVVVTTCVLLYMNPRFSVVDYQAEVILLFSTPDREDVAAFNDYVFTSERDEVTIAINKFVEIAQYPEVKSRTLNDLNIDESYDVAVNAELGADFVHLTIAASTPELAAEIANVHMANAIEYFGELRALSAEQALTYFDNEIALAQQALTDAETALNTFQTENNVILLERELELQYDVLEELEISQSQLLVYQATGGRVNTIGGTEPIAVTGADITNVEALIDAQRGILANLASLEAEYSNLQSELDRAREHRDYLASQQTDIETRQSFSSEAMFIQVIQDASLPSSPEDNTMKTLALGAVGSLGLAILLAFFLDYISKRW